MADELNEAMATNSRADWGKTKFDYYYTDYIDKDYPNELTAKENRLAAIEQEEALRIQKRLLSTIDDADVSNLVFDEEDGGENLIDLIESRNRDLDHKVVDKLNHVVKRKKVTFTNQDGDDDDDEYCSPEEEFFDAQDDEENEEDGDEGEISAPARARRPINTAIEKNRGLTPYKNKKYRNPRVKHKLKFKKVMSKRKRLVREYKPEYNRYSGEQTGIKSSTIRSIKLC